jgi:hypothetical protein
MPTAIDPGRNRTEPTATAEVSIYMHSDLLYWWPVWVVGFAMAAWTYLEGRHVAWVPVGTTVEDRRSVLPDDGDAILPSLHVSASRIPGAAFGTTIIAVLAFGTGWLRSWRAYTFLASLVALVLLITALHGWGDLFRYAALLTIHINLGGYLVLSSAICALWSWQFFVADRWAYVVFSPSQVRVQSEIGAEEKVYDTGGMVFEKRPYDWFRYAVGCGAGDIRLRLGGPQGQSVELPNVPHVHRQLRKIEALLRIKDVQ